MKPTVNSDEFLLLSSLQLPWSLQLLFEIMSCAHVKFASKGIRVKSPDECKCVLSLLHRWGRSQRAATRAASAPLPRFPRTAYLKVSAPSSSCLIFSIRSADLILHFRAQFQFSRSLNPEDQVNLITQKHFCPLSPDHSTWYSIAVHHLRGCLAERDSGVPVAVDSRICCLALLCVLKSLLSPHEKIKRCSRHGLQHFCRGPT